MTIASNAGYAPVGLTINCRRSYVKYKIASNSIGVRSLTSNPSRAF